MKRQGGFSYMEMIVAMGVILVAMAIAFNFVIKFSSAVNTENNTQGGTWSINSDTFDDYDVMAVFKDGNSTNLVAFEVSGSFFSGDWTTPFTDPPFDLPGMSTSKDVSHISFYVREGGGPPVGVPEPGVFGLMALALGVSIVVPRIRRRRA